MQKRTTIDVDFQGFAAALDRKELAEVAEGVSRLCERYGCEAAAQKLGRAQGWISKMRRIAKATQGQSIAGDLVRRGRVRDMEIAYYTALIESKSRRKMCEIADNIECETRQTIKRVWESLR